MFDIMHLVTDPAAWMSLLTLTLLEIVLGIDNVVFLSIITGALPQAQQPLARKLGLALALVMRIILLSMITWLAHSTHSLFSAFGMEISIRDIIMLGGGLFLIWKSTTEMHEMVDYKEHDPSAKKQHPKLSMVILQIAVIDLVFSLDSIITAVGMSGELAIMVAAIVIAILIMLLASGAVSDFVNANPSVKMLALSFILLVGVMLIADGLDFHIPRGYLYFAIAFSLLVECLNLQAARVSRRKSENLKPPGAVAD